MSNTIVSSEVKVRMVPDLSAAAFRTDRDLELAMWYALRSLNTTGSGYISLEEALEGLTRIFGYGQSSVYRILNKGEFQFWQRIDAERGRVIKIYGVKIICLMFGTPLFNLVRFYEVPSGRFNTWRYRRLALWESIHKPQGINANPISRQSIEQYTGVQKRQQIRYDKDSEVKRTPCYRPDHPEQKRSPNIYHNTHGPGHKGMLPKVRRFLKSFRTDEAVEKRVYFGSTSQMLDSKERQEFCYTLIRSTKRKIQGRLEWKLEYSMVV